MELVVSFTTGRFNNAGLKALADERYAKAVEYFSKALKMKFEDAPAVNEGRCLMQLRRFPEALEHLKTAFGKSGSADVFELPLTRGEISCRLNLDRSYVTKEDLIATNIKCMQDEKIDWPDPHDTDLEPRSTMNPRPTTVVKDFNGTIQLGFSRTDAKQLEFVNRVFDAQVARESSAHCVEQTFAHIEKLLRENKNKEATEYLLDHWELRHIDEGGINVKENRLKLKDLLVRSLSWNPEVQKYAIAASVYQITADVLKSQDCGGSLPTITEFQKKKWMASGNFHGREGYEYYFVGVEGYMSGFSVKRESPMFKTIYDQVGETTVNDPAVLIDPLPGNLIDAD